MNKQVSGSRIAEQLFTRPEGATMDEIVAATGGEHYNDLRRLEARGFHVRKVKQGRSTRYFATAPTGAGFYEATVDRNGQVTIPKAVRDQLNLAPGRKVAFEIEPGGRAVVTPLRLSVARLFGVLGKPPRNVSLAEMDDLSKTAAVDRFRRSTDEE